MKQIGPIWSSIYSDSGDVVYEAAPYVYHVEGYMALCADDNYQSFTAASYINGLHSFPAGLSIPNNTNTGCFIARVLEGANGIMIKNLPLQGNSASINNTVFDVSIFPNPATTEVYLHSIDENQTIDKIEICSYTGQFLSSNQAVITKERNYKLNLGKLAAGMYILKISCKDRSVMKKIIIQ